MTRLASHCANGQVRLALSRAGFAIERLNVASSSEGQRIGPGGECWPVTKTFVYGDPDQDYADVADALFVLPGVLHAGGDSEQAWVLRYTGIILEIS